jgi:hypothetical protein
MKSLRAVRPRIRLAPDSIINCARRCCGETLGAVNCAAVDTVCKFITSAHVVC